MKRVIDIEDAVLDCVKDRYADGEMPDDKSVFDMALYAIANGTVLSEGHWIQQPRYEGDDQPNLVCPNCGFKISWWDMGNFCAKCGKGLEGGAG